MNKADLSGIISSPKKPNIMQFLFTLTEEVDCGIIYDAMQKTIKRYPYFAFRIVKAEKGYDKIENPLPIIVKDSFSEELVLGSEDVNYHWIAAACEGRQLKLFIHHIFARDGLPFEPIDETRATVIRCEESRQFFSRIGINGEVIATPSHSPDSISLLLYSGDAFVGDLQPYEYLDGYDGDDAAKADWTRIHGFQTKRIFYAHAN